MAAIELQKRIAEIDRGLRKIMTQLKRALGRFDQFFEASKLAQRSGAAAPGVRIVRRENRRLREARERFWESVGGEQELAEIEMGDDERSVELERAPIEAHRGLRLAAFAQHVPAHAQSVGEIGPQPQRFVHELDRLVAPSFAPQSDGRRVKRVGPALEHLIRRDAN